MTRSYRPIHRGRSGLTLIELLIVCFIIVLFAAIALPLLRPNSNNQKVREAARQFNAYLAEAKAMAAQKAQPVGFVLDRGSAIGEGARDPNIVTRFYLAQTPPLFYGDDLSSRVSAVFIPRDPPPPPNASTFNVTQLQQPPWYDYVGEPSPLVPPPPGPLPNVPPSSAVVETFPPQIGVNKANWYQLNFSSSVMLNNIMATYIPRNPVPGGYRFAPFRIRFNSDGSFFDGYVQYNGPEPPTSTDPSSQFLYICWAPFGKSPPNRPVPFQIEFPPAISSDSPLELPTGTVVDLQFSGLGPSANSFASGSTLPVILMFSASGEVERIYANGTFTNQVTRMHFLVGTLERAVDGTTAQTSNLADPINQWVSVHARTGHVTTADNAPPTDYSTLGTAITQARTLATDLSTKGGR